MSERRLYLEKDSPLPWNSLTLLGLGINGMEKRYQYRTLGNTVLSRVGSRQQGSSSRNILRGWDLKVEKLILELKEVLVILYLVH